jgi:oxygen-independent coproporphyrinogen-3 oxidase
MDLFEKYNVPVPRYTSYPTVPTWDVANFSKDAWINEISKLGADHLKVEGISLYIHLPFCESLCTFCGCNKRITKNHEVEAPYIDTVLAEWRLYLQSFSEKPVISELHLGGGTPTFFSPAELDRLLMGIFSDVQVAGKASLSVEGHPNHTDLEHLQVMHKHGFNRISFGVQDYDPVVQKAINRIQSFERVKEVTRWAREMGFEFISHDLVFGLPYQTAQSIEDTISKTISLKPERISFYSYAHVPWVKGTGQRGFSEQNLPVGKTKRALYELGKAMLEEAGYHEIGFDHFALESDELFKAREKGSMHRNFMGYTTTQSKVLIGLGVSAISDCYTGYAQNPKTLEEYQRAIQKGELAVDKGHIMSIEDIYIRNAILNLMCRFEADLSALPYKKDIVIRLKDPLNDGLIELDENILKVTKEGIPFVRNICFALDLRFHQSKESVARFSAAF